MNVDALKSRVDQINNRRSSVVGRGEAASKQAMVLPMLEALGYDIWNPNEVCPEFEGDFAIKKAGQKEKVDLAILLDGAPRVFIEVKSVEVDLDGHEGQLARYFNAVPSVSLGVLTNGVDYRFFTDSGQPNLMDARPFFVFRVDALDRRLDLLRKFSKDQLDADALREFATELFFTATIISLLKQELDLRGRPPSESLVRWILASEGVYDGRVMASVVERFKPIVGNALQTVLRDVVRRSVAALDQGVNEPIVVSEPVAVEPKPAASDEAADALRPGVVTTERELAAYARIAQLLEATGALPGQVFEPSVRRQVPIELGYKDTTGYFGLYINKPTWWFARLFLDGRQPWVGFNAPLAAIREHLPPDARVIDGHAYAASGVRVDELHELDALSGAFAAALAHLVASREPDVS